MSPDAGDPRIAPSRRKAFDPAGFLARRAVLLAVAGAVLSAALIPALMLAIKPKYAASASLLVDASKEISIAGKERDPIPGDIGDFTRTQIGRMKSVDVLLDALKTVPAAARPVFCDPRDTEVHNAVQLMKQLTITDTPRTHLISAKLEAEEARGLGDTLNAVLDTFLAKLRREQAKQNESRIAYLRDERARMQEMLTGEHKRLLDQAARLPNKAFLHENYSVHVTKLEQIQRMYWEAEVDRAAKESALGKAVADEERLQQLSLRPYADGRVADNFGINRIEQYTYEQLQQMRATLDGLTPDNQDRKYVEQRMDAMNQYLDRHKKHVTESTARELDEKRAYELKSEVIRATTAFEAAKQKSESLAARLAGANQEASATSEAIFNASDVTYSITQLRDRLAALNERIDDCEMESKAPVRISIDCRASNPRLPVARTWPRVVAMGVALGYALVAALLLASELLDGRVRSVRELRAALGAPGPSPIPSHAGGAASNFARIVLEAPESPAAKSLRSLAVRLERERKTHGGRVVLIAGASPRSGATAVASNLADALAGIVARVLCIEMRAAAQGDAAPAAEPAPGVTRMALSASVPDSRIRLRDLLHRSRDAYDFILIDTAPVQADDFAQFAALECDAAVIVARQDRTLFREVIAGLDILRAARITALTVVLNFATSAPGEPPSLGVQRALESGFRAGRRWEAVLRQRWAVRNKETAGA